MSKNAKILATCLSNGPDLLIPTFGDTADVITFVVVKKPYDHSLSLRPKI